MITWARKNWQLTLSLEKEVSIDIKHHYIREVVSENLIVKLFGFFKYACLYVNKGLKSCLTKQVYQRIRDR